MTYFYVHWNSIVRKIKIHRSQCGACKGGAGMHEGRIAPGRGETYDWVSAKTYSDACDIAEELQQKKSILKNNRAKWDCGLCRPRRNL
jgi:phosphopantothenate synthetase